MPPKAKKSAKAKAKTQPKAKSSKTLKRKVGPSAGSAALNPVLAPPEPTAVEPDTELETAEGKSRKLRRWNSEDSYPC